MSGARPTGAAAALIARLKSLCLIGPVIHEGIIRRGVLSKTQICSVSQTTGGLQQKSRNRAHYNRLSSSLDTISSDVFAKIEHRIGKLSHCDFVFSIAAEIRLAIYENIAAEV